MEVSGADAADNGVLQIEIDYLLIETQERLQATIEVR